MTKKYNISQIDKAKTILPIKTTIGFSRVCRAQSKIYLTERDPRLSSAKFFKRAAMEKLLKLGFAEEYLESIM
jgi:hypothetical protein